MNVPINTVDQQGLVLVPGIDLPLSSLIIKKRDKKPFTCPEELIQRVPEVDLQTAQDYFIYIPVDKRSSDEVVKKVGFMNREGLTPATQKKPVNVKWSP